MMSLGKADCGKLGRISVQSRELSYRNDRRRYELIPADSADCEFRGSIETLSFPGIVGLRYELIEGNSGHLIRVVFAPFRMVVELSEVMKGGGTTRRIFFFSFLFSDEARCGTVNAD